MAQLTIGQIFRRNGAARPHAVAAFMGGRTLSFREVDDGGDRFATVLRDLGIRRRERVVWWGDTTIDAVPLFAGLARRGAVFAPVNARLTAAEAAPVVACAKPAVVVVDATHSEHAAAVAAGVPTIPLDELHERAAAAPARPFDDDVDERDPHVIFFTSGSTGAAKGVVLSHRANFLRGFPGNVRTTNGPTVCMFPMFHMAAWSMALGCWHAGNEIAFVETADAATLLSTAEGRRAARLYAIPAVWARLLAGGIERYDLSSLREADTGTSATPPELVEAIRAALPWTETRIIYGSTEAGPGTVLPTEDLLDRPGSVGRPNPGVELRLGDGGEIQLRSPFLMDGYFENPEATAAALTADGWYCTGDAGVLDDGYLSVVGRLRDVIRTGGETVAPPEVEDAVARHPAVAEVAVVGLPDPEWGEVVCAAVVLQPGAALTLDDLRASCDGVLAPFKQPRRLAVVDALPRTAATGQVQRALIVERLSAVDPLR